MRFAITASDRYLGVFEAFLDAGWTPVKLFTVPVDNRMFHNKAVIDRAQRLGIPIQISRLREADLAELKERGCDALIVASYMWRVGDWERHLRFAVNFHPSPLPQGRGPYPAVRAILDGWDHWGVTCHRLAREFDSGDILAQERFPLAPDECHESLDLKSQFACRKLARRVAAGFEPLWNAASPQGEGSYWKLFTEADRTLDFHQPVADILRRVRAFGDHECLARVSGVGKEHQTAQVFVRRAVGWQEPHRHAPGLLVLRDAMRLVISTTDGYVGLLEWSVISPDAQVGRIGR